jgi:diguanylate cyclase (GGDEF)-like protein
MQVPGRRTAPCDVQPDGDPRLLLARLHHLESLLTGILESTDTELAVVDEHLMVMTANESFRRQFLDGADPTGMSLGELAGLVSESPMLDVLDVVRQSVEFSTEVTVFVRDRIGPAERWLDVTASPLGILPGAVLRARDVTGLVRAAHAGMVGRVQDTLTGLLTRDGIEELLTAEFRRIGTGAVCVAMLEIDQFHVVNRTLGYGAGDELLRHVAAVLRQHVPADGNLARLVGDTFCITFHYDDALEVDRVSAELRDAVRQPVAVRGRTMRITASVGSTLARCGDTVEHVIQQAELAMQEANRRGGNRCVPYAPDLAESQQGVIRVWNALRSALQFRQMEVWFQPIVSLATDRPIAAEALCRWHHPQFGDVSPAEFIPIAERNSEILNIGSFVHGRAAEMMNVLRAGHTGRLGGFQISVNASPNELAWPDFAANLLARLRANEARPEWFALEITEQGLLQPDEAVRNNVRVITDAGMTLSLDDFGTGYSSLERLRDIAVHRVKIDRRFVASMMENERSERLVAAIITLAEELGMDTVAEGVETVEQAARLRALGCRSAQGFLFAPAVPDSELTAVLRDLASASDRRDIFNAAAAIPRLPAAVHGG